MGLASYRYELSDTCPAVNRSKSRGYGGVFMGLRRDRATPEEVATIPG